MARIRKRSEEELKKEREIEDGLKEKRQEDCAKHEELINGLTMGVDLATGSDALSVNETIIMSGLKSGKTQAMKDWGEHPDQTGMTKRQREFEREYLNNLIARPIKGRRATAIVADEMCNDEQLAQQHIDAEIKRGERQKAREKKREGCMNFVVHLLHDKYLSKDYEMTFYFNKSKEVVDIEEPNLAAIMTSSTEDAKHLRALKEIMKIELRKFPGNPPLSFSKVDTIIDDYLIGDL